MSDFFKIEHPKWDSHTPSPLRPTITRKRENNLSGARWGPTQKIKNEITRDLTWKWTKKSKNLKLKRKIDQFHLMMVSITTCMTSYGTNTMTSLELSGGINYCQLEFSFLLIGQTCFCSKHSNFQFTVHCCTEIRSPQFMWQINLISLSL